MERRYSSFKAYAASKRAVWLFTCELAERLTQSGDGHVTVNAAHPGHVRTGIWNLWEDREKKSWFQRLFLWFNGLFMVSVEKGAETVIYCAVSDEAEGITGGYFAEKKLAGPAQGDVVPGAKGWSGNRKGHSGKQKELQRRLWELGEGFE